MANIHQPEARERVDIAVAVNIGQPDAVAFDQHFLAGVMGECAIGRGVHEQVLGTGFLQGFLVGKGGYIVHWGGLLIRV